MKSMLHLRAGLVSLVFLAACASVSAGGADADSALPTDTTAVATTATEVVVPTDAGEISLAFAQETETTRHSHTDSRGSQWEVDIPRSWAVDEKDSEIINFESNGDLGIGIAARLSSLSGSSGLSEDEWFNELVVNRTRPFRFRELEYEVTLAHLEGQHHDFRVVSVRSFEYGSVIEGFAAIDGDAGIIVSWGASAENYETYRDEVLAAVHSIEWIQPETD